MRIFKEQVKVFGRCLLFFAILACIIFALSGVVENTLLHHDSAVSSRNKSLMQIQKEKENTIDVMIVGDSLSYTAISPMELWKEKGITSFVGGQSGQRIQETYVMLLTAFEKQSPRLVVMETNLLFRGKPGIQGVQETLEAFGNRYLPIARGHDVWKTWLIDKKYPQESFKGFSFRCGVKSYSEGSSQRLKNKPSDINHTTKEYMEKIAELCKEHDAQLLLVSVPSPLNYTAKRLEAVRALARENDIDYLDLNSRQDELNIDWHTDTLDKGDHLNLLGAQKVSRFMGEYMANHYHLEDRRAQKEYDDWNQIEAKYSVKALSHIESMEEELSKK